MAANTSPIFTLLGDIQWGAADGNGGSAGPLKTANTAKDGTGTVLTIFTADATNGGYIREVRIRHAGTNIASVLRLFVNNGSTNGTIANNVLIDEASLIATTLNETGALPPSIIPCHFALPPGYKLNVAIGTTLAAGVFVSAIGGKY